MRGQSLILRDRQQRVERGHRLKRKLTLEQNVPKFVRPNEWPPNSPDLNIMDYFVWGALNEMVYSTENLKPGAFETDAARKLGLVESRIDRFGDRSVP